MCIWNLLVSFEYFIVLESAKYFEYKQGTNASSYIKHILSFDILKKKHTSKLDKFTNRLNNKMVYGVEEDA